MFAAQRTLFFVLVLMVVPAAATTAGAQTATATLSANLGGVAKLSISTTTLAFPDANPDLFSSIPASSGPIAITAKARGSAGSTITLTVLATDDLRSGVDTIPVSALTWTASGPGFVSGTLSRATPQPVGSWSGSGIRTGTQTYQFANSWNYASGTYSVAILYTLTSP